MRTISTGVGKDINRATYLSTIAEAITLELSSACAMSMSEQGRDGML